MSIEQAYLLVMGIVILFAVAGGLFIMWNARGKAKEK
jgi:hypothetical protein